MIPLLLLSLILLGCERLETVFVEEDLLERPQAKRCSDCHVQIYKEWKNSRHFHAWTSEPFRVDSENYTKTKCLSCHAPHQVDPDRKPTLRAEFKEDGVSCVACHFKEETRAMHGPLKVWSPPHPSKQDMNYTKSNFCAGCHQETYKEWKLTGTSKSCQSCHMPSLGKRDLIQKFPFDLFHLAKPRTSHEFPSLKAKSDDIRVQLEGNELVLTNTGVPHNLPTADQGDSRLYLIAKVVYRDGKERTVRKLLSAQSKTALRYEVPYVLNLPKGDVQKVELKILRKLAWSKDRETLLELTLQTPSP
ncbi:cytochrome c554/c'-like protein [Hydrogenivirga caldilitoris]|uniref:Cytochrome c554/c'-like protein n=1 Tax=Hydrogenivirga caldilitoris TaxID=246264 RepID=A0A497XRY1_9AQUI|nr:multiheme c-type cytochrome [Hydrogenivirga caldilitoris]RLJ69892.1 cytochrome c554/c'-like protein [Hydrogenivirga caldilitoris]